MKLAHYQGSTDHGRLAELVEVQGIMCIVNDQGTRQVAMATRWPHHRSWMWQVGTKGYSYFTAFTLEEFISFCRHYELEFFEPFTKVD